MAYRFADDLETKVCRIRDGGPIRCLDIFSGMGGWSLGFRAAGGLIVGGIDINPVAAAFHHKLFGPVNPAKDGEVGPYDQDSDPCDITSADEFRVAADYAPVDILIASPPCQAWSRIGRARLRQLFGGTEEHRANDHRFGLHREIGRLAAALRPLAVVVENVPDAARSFPEVAQDLDLLGYTVRWTILNAAHYGTPQLRPRLYLIAVHAGAIRVVPKFPEPTTRWALTEGYGNIATFVSRTDCGHFVRPPKPRKGLPLAPTVADALDDLPSLDGSRVPPPPSDYALSLGAGTVTVTDHVGRPTSVRDRRIIDGMRPDANKIDAWNNIEHLADEEIRRLGLHGADAEALRRSWIPPWNGRERRTHRDHWRRLDGEKPSVVLVSHLDTDSFSHKGWTPRCHTAIGRP